MWRFLASERAFIGRELYRRARSTHSKSHPELEVNLARLRREHKPHLQGSRLLASAKTFEACPRVRVELVGQPAGRLPDRARRDEVVEERLRGEVRDLTSRRLENGGIRGDEQHPLELAVLGGEALEERVGVRREANGERTFLGGLSDAVEDDDATGARRRDEARERVDQLAAVGVR